MDILAGRKLKAPERKKTLRETCHDYEGAMRYLAANAAKGKYVYSNEDGEHWVRVTLHSMPIYIELEELDAVNEVRKPVTLELIRKEPQLLGKSMIECESEEDAKSLAQALCNGESPMFNEAVKRAAKALQSVDTEELPAIAKHAEHLYNQWREKMANDSNADAKRKAQAEAFGDWSFKDDNGQRISKEKANRLNMYKQQARRQLGYARGVTEVVERV